MKISFRRSGGFAPMPLECHLDSETMPPEQRNQLLKLLDKSDIWTSGDAMVKGARDVHFYFIDIADGIKRHSLTVDEISLSENMRALVNFLLEHSVRAEGDGY